MEELELQNSQKKTDINFQELEVYLGFLAITLKNK